MLRLVRAGTHLSPLARPCRRTIKTLVIADDLITGSVEAAKSAISAAQCIKQPVSFLIAGGDSAVDKVIPLFSKVPNLEKILVAKGDKFKNCFPEEIDRMIKVQVETGKYSRILLAHTAYGRQLAPRIAALLGVNQVSDAIELSDSHCVRGTYAGNVLTKHYIKDEPILVITIRQSIFKPAVLSQEEGRNVPVEQITFEGIESHATRGKILIQDERSTQNTSSMPELATAKTIVCGGRAFGTKENFQMVYDLASCLKAAVASTRAAVDSNIAPSDTQVGQTGKSVAPTLYIALGVSGAIQHISAITNSKVIVSVNTDNEAPIFDYSDYGLVADIFEVVPELIKKLNAEKNNQSFET